MGGSPFSVSLYHSMWIFLACLIFRMLDAEWTMSSTSIRSSVMR